MLGEVLGVERRRRWSDDEKLEILSEVGVGGASVTQVAQRHETTRSQIYGWRRELKKKGLWSPDRGAVFLPVDFGEARTPASAPAPGRPGLSDRSGHRGAYAVRGRAATRQDRPETGQRSAADTRRQPRIRARNQVRWRLA